MSSEVNDMNYTDEQLQAIKTSGSNLLVSASAGSGKTTVLIERIIHKLKTENINIDELLIVTFTEAAASELKQRLRVKLTKELLENPINIHLRKQLPKIGTSHISTFHAFCNQVIQKFFYLIDFDAVYSVADEIEVKMIAEDVMEELFSDCFEANDEQFIMLVERFSQKTQDEPFRKLLKSIYDKMRAIPYKERFINDVKDNYHVLEDLSSWPLFPAITKLIEDKLSEAQAYFRNAYEIACRFNHPYMEQYDEDQKIIDTLNEIIHDSFDHAHTYLNSLQFSTFKSKCEEIDETNKEAVKNFRKKGKDIIMDEVSQYFSYREKSQVKFIKENKKIVDALFYVLELFDKRFTQAKRDKGIVDFSDLEEMTLKILSGNNEAVKYYRNQFKEILVDEFQDTNSMQETIISSITSGNNLFMVGDVKQSIYRFRNAEPEIFQNKYKDYQTGKGGRLINLNANYRSRREVLQFINFLFYQLMDEDLFEITYDYDASLIYGQKEYLDKPLNGTFIHVHLLDKEKLSEEKEGPYAKCESEAHYVAQEIRNLIDSQSLIYDSKLKDLRPVKYKDIVILSRTKGDQDTYNDIFKKYNIPFLTAELSGYFDSIEVLTVTSILRTIDNPLQDIPVIASLRSPIFQVNEKELIDIKINSDKDYYYQKIEDYIKTGSNSTLIAKLKYFIEEIEKWREVAKSDSLTDLLYRIYHETNYYDFVLGQVGGQQRQANLDLLYDRAKSYENIISNSLFKFVQLINFFQDNDSDLPQARTLSDNEDLVRFMSIHKSKGLEFPIVFVVNLNKEYNTNDEKSQILWDKELGIAFGYFDQVYRVKYPTLYQTLIKDRLHKQLLAEEMRLLYVALTRAKEQLFLIGTVEFAKELSKLTQINSICDILLPKDVRRVNDYLSLILLALSRHPDFVSLCNLSENIQFIGKMKEIPQLDIRIIKSQEYEKTNIISNENYEIDFSQYLKKISDRLKFTYPHYEKTIHFAKQTIADIKRASYLSEYQFHQEKLMLKKPQFVDLNKASATLRGTSIHQFMQHIDYRKVYTLTDLMDLRNRLIEKEVFNKKQAELVVVDKIYAFLQTDIAQKIASANSINREMPFTTLINSKKVYPDLQDEFEVMVQGVVDLLVEYDDCCVLIDFKSDRVDNTNEAIERLRKQYQIQLDVYKEAMKNLLNEKDIQVYLYLFEINKFVEM